MSHSDIESLKASDLSAEELRLQKAQQVIDELLMAANSDETLKEQLDAATRPESLVEVAVGQGYELTVADLETLLRRNQEQLQLHSDEFDDDELSEQELELVAGGGSISAAQFRFAAQVLLRNGWRFKKP
ncbi:MAG: Nif11-like leader peptide family natural product precursor [Coleofasciculus sp. C3-bin4]|nr:Nif11-like leader peptide family natural product precursor [Coleofasciculus sp. C3-bin4]